MTRLPRSGRQSLGIHRESCQRHRQALLPPASIGTAAEQQGLGTGVRLRRRGGELRGRGRRGLATGAMFRRRGRRCGGQRARVAGGGRGADGHLRRFRVRPARAGGAATSTATRPASCCGWQPAPPPWMSSTSTRGGCASDSSPRSSPSCASTPASAASCSGAGPGRARDRSPRRRCAGCFAVTEFKVQVSLPTLVSNSTWSHAPVVGGSGQRQ